MVRDERPRGSGWGKAILLGLACLLAGLAIGRARHVRGVSGSTAWRDEAELHQLFNVPSSYNFVESNKAYEHQLLGLIHDSLIRYDPVQNEVVPALARTYEVSRDQLTWTFHLREAQTPEGNKLTADDVVFSFGLFLDARFDNKRRGNLIMKNKQVEATAVDPRTVRFRLPEPFYSFPWAIVNLYVVPKTTFESVAGDVKKFREAVGVQQPELKYIQGFGPYYVASQDTQEIRLIRNDKFWDRGDEHSPRPHLSQITLTLRKDPTTNQLDFRQNDDLVYRNVGPTEANDLKQDTNFEILDLGRGGGCMFFWVNQNPQAPWGKSHPNRLKLFQNVAFRRAIAHAIDRQAIIREVFKGYAEPVYGPASPVFRWVAPEEVLREVTPALDPAAAVAELAKLGVTPGEPDSTGKRWLTYEEEGKRVPLEIEIRTSRSEEDMRRKTAEAIKSQLEEIGVRVSVVEEQFGDMVMRLDKTYDYEAAVMQLDGSPDAAVLKFFFESSGPMHFVNPYQKSPATEWERKVDELFERYTTAPDAAAREKAIIEMQKTWVAAQPAFHLYTQKRLVAVRRDYEVNGLAPTGRAMDPILQRPIIENVRIRRVVPR